MWDIQTFKYVHFWMFPNGNLDHGHQLRDNSKLSCSSISCFLILVKRLSHILSKGIKGIGQAIWVQFCLFSRLYFFAECNFERIVALIFYYFRRLFKPCVLAKNMVITKAYYTICKFSYTFTRFWVFTSFLHCLPWLQNDAKT